jgi:hypothetical protein
LVLSGVNATSGQLTILPFVQSKSS